MSTTTDTDLAGDLARVAPQVVAWRRHLHAHPELSHHEFETAAYLAAQLESLGLAVERPSPNSAVATLTGALAGPTIAIRADIDALPIVEATGLPFASTNPGVMHACGHDGHAAVLLGVASILTARREQIRGRVRFIFQHAEEKIPMGAADLIDAGVLDGVDVIIGQHLWAGLPVGTIGVRAGAFMASPDSFDLTFTGRGGHAGMPHDTVESIPAAADFVQGAARIAAREFAPDEPVVVSITQLHAGDAYNVIPAETIVRGTARALDPDVRTRLVQRITELAGDVGRLHRVAVDFDYRYGPPALINTASVIDTMRAAAGPSDTVSEIEPTMGGDDFAAYLEHVPGAYVFVGATEPGTDPVFPHHHPQFDISERALPIATALLTRAALALAEQAWPAAPC